MFNTYHRLLQQPVYFRVGFMIVLITGVILDSLFYYDSLHIFYVLSVIFLGLGFFNARAWVIVSLTTIVVLCRVFISLNPSHSFVNLFIFFLTYFLITYISVGLMKNVQKGKKDNLELTAALAEALDTRDSYTSHHSANVSNYAAAIAKKMGLSKEVCEAVRIGGLLHDIGKIGIKEHVLIKPEALTEEEYGLIKKHPKKGYEIIKHIESFHRNGVLDIVLYHHERFDGEGYPAGLKGRQIPLTARIIAVADAFDAMTTNRVYRMRFDIEHALREIHRNRGTQFDPEVADVFLSLFEKAIDLEAITKTA